MSKDWSSLAVLMDYRNGQRIVFGRCIIPELDHAAAPHQALGFEVRPIDVSPISNCRATSAARLCALRSQFGMPVCPRRRAEVTRLKLEVPGRPGICCRVAKDRPIGRPQAPILIDMDPTQPGGIVSAKLGRCIELVLQLGEIGGRARAS